MTPSLCPHCGRPALSDDDTGDLTRIQRRIFSMLQRHGEMYPESIYAALYGGDPNGGPDPKTLEVHISLLNKRLRSRGVAVRRKRPSRWGQPWRIVPIAEAAE